MKLVIDTTESTFEEAMAAVRTAYGREIGQSQGVRNYQVPGRTVWSHNGGWFIQQWNAPMLRTWMDGLQETELLAAAWLVCRKPGIYITIPELAQFIAPGGDERWRLARARRAVQAMMRLGRGVGSMGGMPFDKREKGPSAYRAAKPVAAFVQRQIKESPLYDQLTEEYPAIGEAASASR
ncbi:hypothetical protein ACIRYZ_39055 [Kitasatospora sp. NPDC101155]|uniref:hypothetical protein n=1 Tax=Kitasatospora sp. NPDC101155 TaxID=3364097 RepID=UPI0038170663